MAYISNPVTFDRYDKDDIWVVIPNKAWGLGKGDTVIGLYPTREEFELAYQRYAVLSENNIYASEVNFMDYIPLPREKKSYKYWYVYLYYELKYQLRKIYKLFKREKPKYL